MHDLEALRSDETDVRETIDAIEALRAALVPPDAQITQDSLSGRITDSQMHDLETAFEDDAALEQALEAQLDRNRAALAEYGRQRREVSEELRRAEEHNRALGSVLEQVIRFCEAPI
jgi:hypothetical protein